MEEKEKLLRKRHAMARERWDMGTKRLQAGDTAILQNQCGNKPLKWDRTGTVIEVGNKISTW